MSGLRPALFLPIAILSASSLAAQTPGLPIAYRSATSGFESALDVGFDSHGFRTVAATGTVTLAHFVGDGTKMPLFNLSPTAARVAADDSVPAGWAVGANLAVLNSFTLGAGYARTGTTTRVHIPLSAVLPLAECAGPRGVFIFYAVPIWNFDHRSSPLVNAWERSWGSLDGGVLLELHNGIGVQLGAGHPFRHAPDQLNDRWVFGIGVHFARHGLARWETPKTSICSVGL